MSKDKENLPADRENTAEKVNAEKAPAEKPAAKKPAAEKPATDAKNDTAGKPSDKKPADKKHADEKPADEKPADEKPAGSPIKLPTISVDDLSALSGREKDKAHGHGTDNVADEDNADKTASKSPIEDDYSGLAKTPSPDDAAASKKSAKKEEKEAAKAAEKRTKDLAKDQEKKKIEEDKQKAAQAKTVLKEDAQAKAKAITEAKKDAKKNRHRYGEVMTTGQFLGALVLMLIPGVNIFCVIIWALGGSRNHNKVHFSRAAILFFLIEILLTALCCAGVYIYFNQNQTAYIKKADTYTNGLFTYFDINSYKDLKKLRNIPDYLVDKNSTDEEETETRVLENPDGITSYEDFMNMYDDYIAERDGTSKTTTSGKTSTLKDILEVHNVDTTKSGLVYIILDSGKNDCVIAFDPTGNMQSYPTIEVNNERIYVGGEQ